MIPKTEISDDKLVISIEDGDYKHDPSHKYLKWSKGTIAGSISWGAQILTEQFLKEKRPISKWRNDTKEYIITSPQYYTNIKIESLPFNYSDIAKDLRIKGLFNPNDYKLPLIFSNWLDRTLQATLKVHLTDSRTESLQIKDGNLPLEYGESFPIVPILDREGHIFTTFHSQLIKRIIDQRKSIVENSHLAFETDWLFNLRSLINDSVSIIDITLNQLYTKAEYSPQLGWNFEPQKLGSKINRRIKDKLKWVRLISGNSFNIEEELPKFERLRRIRNHLNHFDPPTLVITLEEAAEWLNDILYIARILIKIRLAVKTEISTSLIELLVQNKVFFNPEERFKNRFPLKSPQAGYFSSVWQSE